MHNSASRIPSPRKAATNPICEAARRTDYRDAAACMQRLIFGSDEHFASGPRQFVIVEKFVTVVRDLLVSAIGAVFRNCALEKFPALLRLLKIQGGTLRELLFESG